LPAEIIDGKAIAARLRERYAVEVSELKARGVHPGLAVVLVGGDPASQVYVNMKGRDCDEVGIYSEKVHLPEETTEAELLATIDRLNADPKIHGMIVQLPVPKQINADRVLRHIDPRKDADGFHPENVGRVFVGDPEGFPPATPFGVQHLLIESNVETAGAHAVIVGRSNIVGRPMASLLWQRGPGADATVTVCHSRTRNLPEITRLADILIVAIGRPNFVTGGMVNPGAVVIDVGVNRVEDPTAKRGYRLVGDVEFDTASEVASLITPVPGGVGPMTRAMLLHNTIKAARQWAAN
jgi:methylenetetrahydrofolate dehydrogenase (NADP+) / methenyltetrahydrofolate cyclohydrolase